MDQFKTLLAVKKLMSKDIFTTNIKSTVTEAAKQMSKHKTDCILVMDGKNEVVGIVTESDIVRKVVAKEINPSAATVKDLMSEPLLDIASDESIFEAKKIMEKHNVRHLIVKENGKLVGIVAARDLVKS
ncbi:MAG: CBS domain-containing protein [Nitrospinae bacterium]|nr:CBS domain-containing protein [Nitrospinota bacterium]MBI3813311.1 CBS domain-containing protein [Nitrospinota bacterium]